MQILVSNAAKTGLWAESRVSLVRLRRSRGRGRWRLGRCHWRDLILGFVSYWDSLILIMVSEWVRFVFEVGHSKRKLQASIVAGQPRPDRLSPNSSETTLTLCEQ